MIIIYTNNFYINLKFRYFFPELYCFFIIICISLTKLIYFFIHKITSSNFLFDIISKQFDMNNSSIFMSIISFESNISMLK